MYSSSCKILAKARPFSFNLAKNFKGSPFYNGRVPQKWKSLKYILKFHNNFWNTLQNIVIFPKIFYKTNVKLENIKK